MKYRCHQEHHPLYKWYGARGIRVCDRWLTDRSAFIADMLPTWKPGLSLERIDNDKDYAPDNCRWAMRAAQARNRTNNHLIETDFGLMHIADAEDFFGYNRGIIRGRIMRGWPPRLAVSAPIGTRLADLE